MPVIFIHLKICQYFYLLNHFENESKQNVLATAIGYVCWAAYQSDLFAVIECIHFERKKNNNITMVFVLCFDSFSIDFKLAFGRIIQLYKTIR